ncbi:MAG: hypothetical protein IKJ58_08700, partial [Akkermansia sp.]|nr:hypothetical protein [Akkermansia sp.]
MGLLYHFIPSAVNPLWGGAIALPQKYSSAIHAINIKKVALPPAKQEVGRNDTDEYVINNYLLLSIQ